MDINIKLAESLIDAFDNEETAIVLWDKNDNVMYRNKKTSERWIKLNLDFEIGQNFFDRIQKVEDLNLMTHEELIKRSNNFKLAKSSGNPQEYVIKGPTGRWVQIKDTPTAEGNMLTLMTNVTKIVEQDLERKRLVSAINSFPSGIMFWDENDELIIANKKTEQLHKQWGVNFKLKKGTKFEEMLRKQIYANLYQIPEEINSEEYISLRLSERSKLTSGSREVSIFDGSTILANEIKFEDGSLLSIYTDITDLKKQQLEFKQLADAIEFTPSNLMLWDKHNKLIMANKKARDENAKRGFNLKKGSSRVEMVKNALQKGLMEPPKGISNSKFLKQRKKQFENLKDQETYEVIVNKEFYLASSYRLPDKSTLQFVTNITQNKKQEIELLRLKDGIDILPNGLFFWDENNKLIATNKSAIDHLKGFGFDLRLGVDRFDHVKHLVDHNYNTIQSGLNKKTHIKRMKESWNNFTGQRLRETKFSNGLSFLFTDTRLKDGSTISLWSDITSIKQGEESQKQHIDAIDVMPSSTS